MKSVKYLIIVLFILSSCNKKYDEDTFSSTLQAISQNEMLLNGENDRAIERILKLVEDNPQSLDYRLLEWESKEDMWDCMIKITTSEDGNVRVYNINNNVPDGNLSFGSGGTWIIQYRIDGDVYTDVWDGKHSFVKNIYSVQSSTKTYYLFVDYSGYIRQGEFMNETITSYSVNHQTHKFQKEKPFKTAKKNRYSIDIDWIDCYDSGDGMVYSELNHIYCDGEKLRVPLVTDNGIMTEGYLLYIWNGETFEYKGIDPIAEFKANKFTIRIEILSDGSYKYSSWGKNKSTEQSPDLILYNGKMECWDETGKCECNSIYDNGVSTILGRKYTFENNGRQYQFEYGWWEGHFREYFTIFNGEEEILSSKAEVVWINGMQLQ